MDPAQVKEFWPFVIHLLRPAVAKTGLSDFDSIARDVLEGFGLLWLAWSDHIEAAATTALVPVEADLYCVITACGGTERNRWLPLLEGIEKYARTEGCKAVRIFGRRGWERALEGYNVTNIVLEKAL